MANKREIDKLRAEVIKRQRAASNKMSRLRRQQGVEVSGSSYDPRKSRDHINRLNTSQLNALLGRINDFTSRSTQFINTGNGAVSRADWQKFERNLERANAVKRKRRETVGQEKIGPGTETAEKRRHNRYGTAPRSSADGGYTSSPFDEQTVIPEMVQGLEALKRLSKRFARDADPGHERKNMKSWRKSAFDMLEALGSYDLAGAVMAMPLRNFRKLWYSGFAEAIAPKYMQYMRSLQRNAEGELESREDRENQLEDEGYEREVWKEFINDAIPKSWEKYD